MTKRVQEIHPKPTTAHCVYRFLRCVRYGAYLNRRGTSLIELTATLMTSAILITGLVSSILISQRSLQTSTAHQQNTVHQRHSMEQLRADLREATKIESTTSTNLSITVPDRTGDDIPDVITYDFPASGSTSLSRTANSVTIPYSMGTIARTNRPSYTVPTAPVTPTPTVLRVSGFSSNLSSNSTTSISLQAPSNSLAGDMLVLVLSANSTSGTFTVTPGSWTSLYNRSNVGLQQRVWWRLATADETTSTTINCTNSIRMSAGLIRLSGHNGTITPHTSTSVGTSVNPTSVGCATTTNNMLLFRVLTSNDDCYFGDFTGLYNHHTLIMRSGDTSSSAVMLGVGYRKIPTPTTSTTINFALADSEPFITGSFAVGAVAN
jgi:hypothetical protein